MIKYFHFEEKDTLSIVNRALKCVGNENKLVSLRKLDFIYDNSCVNPCIVCKFLKVLVPLKTVEEQTTLLLVLQEVTHNNEVEGLVFTAACHNEHAFLIDKAIKSGKILIGNLLVISKLKILLDGSQNNQSPNDRDINLRVVVQVSKESVVNVLQCNNNAYLQYYTRSTSDEYKQLSVFYVDDIRSTRHALANLFCLIKGKGNVVTMKEVTSLMNSKINPIVIAQLKKTVSCLSIYKEEAEIQVSFEEVFFRPSTCYRKSFDAFFFGECAIELQRALDNRDITPGDLVAIVHPVFSKFTGAPVNIRFPPSETNNLIVLQCRHPNRDRALQMSIHDLNFYNCSTPIESDQPKGIKFLNCRISQCKRDTLDQIAQNLKKYGAIKTIKAAAVENKSNSMCSSGLVLSQFLKLVTPLRVVNEGKRALLLFREIHLNCHYGPFFKVNLHNKLAENFCSCLQNGRVLKGDIIVFINVIMSPSPEYLARDLIFDEPVFLDVYKEPILVYKLIKSSNQDTDRHEILENPNTVQHGEKCAAGIVHLPEDELGSHSTFAENNLDLEANADVVEVNFNKSVKHSASQVVHTQAPFQENNVQPEIEIGNTESVPRVVNPQPDAPEVNTQPLSKVNDMQSATQEPVTQPNSQVNNVQTETEAANTESASRVVNPQPGSRKVNTQPLTQVNNMQYATQEAVTQPTSQINNLHTDIEVGNADSAPRVFNPQSDSQEVNTQPASEENDMQTLNKVDNTQPDSQAAFTDFHLAPPLSDKTNSEDLFLMSPFPEHNTDKEENAFDERSKVIKRKASDSCLKIPKVYVQEQGDFLIAPLSILRPCLKDNVMNLILGKCLTCSETIPFSSLLFFIALEPLCPRCFVQVEIMFQIEMDVLVLKTQKFMNVVLEGEKAERFLGVTCKDFLSNKEFQRVAVKNIEEKTAGSKKFKNCSLRLKDVSTYHQKK